MPRPPAPRRLYSPLPYLMVRAPLLSTDAYRELSEAAEVPGALRRFLEKPLVHAALAVGSQSLLEALGRGGANVRKASQADSSLLRYLIRMSTRATPYGLFAGIALARWGEGTDLALGPGPHATRTRPDMGWLMALVERLDARPELRRHLRWMAHPGALDRAGRIWLEERPSRPGSSSEAVSLRATGAVRRALAAARTPVAYSSLVRHLLDTTPGATEPKVEALLSQLWEHSLLHTDLRPPLLTEDPLSHVLERLAGVPGVEEERAGLRALADALAHWDALPFPLRAQAFGSLVRQARRLQESQAPAFQVDMALPLGGRQVSPRVGAEVARAAELLLRLSPVPSGPTFLSEYRRQFVDRYGPHQEVPLLEVLEPTFGLGPPAAYTPHGPHRPGAPAPAAPSPRRMEALLHLAARAARERQRTVELDDATLEALELGTLSAANAPRSLEVFASVAASSAQALDEGDFQVVVAGAGVAAAGRSLGRFADLLGPEAVTALTDTACAEEALRPGTLSAEPSYLPREQRIANVAVRPAVRELEIPLLITPGVPPGRVLPLEDLLLGVREGRFYLRSASHGAEVVICSGHMLTSRQGPAVIRFLSDVGQDGQRQFYEFSWGPASNLPFLPRVQRGRAVLALAQWRISSATREHELRVDSPEVFTASLAAWRERWDVPRFVSFSIGDNRLVLDLERATHREELRAELHGPGGQELILQEVLPALDQAWLEGPEGRYVTELVVPLVRRPLSETEQRPVLPEKRGAPARPRSHAPGGEWLFARIYCGPRLEEELIAGPLRTFAREALRAGDAEDWFFIRYTDPDLHVRLRFRGLRERLTARLLPALCQWGAELIHQERARRFTLDCYEPEQARYGGEAGLSAAESLFGADSRAVSELLGLYQAQALELERPVLAVLSCDRLLEGLGLSPEVRHAWLAAQLRARRGSAASYRKWGRTLQSLLRGPEALGQVRGGDAVHRILEARRAELAPVGARLAELEASGQLLRPRTELYSSYLHMHCNRLFGVDGAAEQEAMELLLRVRTSLRAEGQRAPPP